VLNKLQPSLRNNLESSSSGSYLVENNLKGGVIGKKSAETGSIDSSIYNYVQQENMNQGRLIMVNDFSEEKANNPKNKMAQISNAQL
jgi:uncharacterized protein (UPF0179 family)